MIYDFIVESWHFDQQGKSTPIESNAQLENDSYWLHCNRSSAQFEKWLMDEGVDESIIESLLASDTRPRFQQIDDSSFFLILRGVNLNAGKEPDDMLSIRLLYTPKRVITCNLQQSKAIASVAKDLRKARGPENIEQLVIAILTQLNAKIDAVIEPIEDFINAQDSDEFSNEQISEINSQHRKLLKLNRFLKPQLYALSALSKNDIAAFEPYKVNIANQLDTLQRIVDTIDFYIAQIDVINNRIAQLNSEVMNRNTYLLSIIAGIFLPLGFLTGLFGINIGGMPGVENSSAFYWFCGLLTGIGVFEIYLFKRLRFL
ncbi:zinc transporter ZntB [Litorilituus sediminis]|uniref:Zinc transporter ZntB n=1 Tax=Litorilituus sediminis TaxID=718192 RepID=A0A4P6P0B9_9GAMM|nr:zinc transporter ZntB [Litorilituus sediminis]QBG34291.1 zinc transporter ZntB [Litorilituus sediminis]